MLKRIPKEEVLAVILSCQDHRRPKTWTKLMKLLDLEAGQYYSPAFAGSSKTIAEAYRRGNRALYEFLVEQVGIGINHGGAGYLYLHHHKHCTFYGIPEPVREKKIQLEDCLTSYQLLSSEYPNVDILMIWEELLDITGSVSKFFVMSVEQVEDEIFRLKDLLAEGSCALV